jgi:hypothetical protein
MLTSKHNGSERKTRKKKTQQTNNQTIIKRKHFPFKIKKINKRRELQHVL